MTYKTKGTCSTMIDIEMEPDQHTIKSVAFTGGCNGCLGKQRIFLFHRIQFYGNAC